MRYGANLNIILKSIEKASSFASRDFTELENLQRNPASADKFANACYNRVKKVLAEDLMALRGEYNVIFADGQKIINNENAEYSYVIYPIDGLHNLTRSNPDFTIAVALEHLGEDGKRESIAVAIHKAYGRETYYAEKGYGAYLNNHRIRTSQRSTSSAAVVASEDWSYLSKKFEKKPFSFRAYGSRSLEVSYVASGRLEMAIFKKKNYDLLKPFFVLVKEAGGKIEEDGKHIIVSA